MVDRYAPNAPRNRNREWKRNLLSIFESTVKDGEDTTLFLKLFDGLHIQLNNIESRYDMGTVAEREGLCVICSKTIERIKDTDLKKKREIANAFANHPLCVKCSTEGYWRNDSFI